VSHRTVSPPRELSVDAYRVCAAVLIVVGHWLAASITYHDGQFTRQNALVELPWTQWLTLIFQVVPVFFLVAGFASAASWSRRGASSLPEWLTTRYRAVLGPTAAYVVVMWVAVGALIVTGFDADLRALSGWAVGMHLWFIPMYLALVGMTPLAVSAHRRWGLWVPVVLAAAVAAVDAVSLSGWIPGLGWANNVLCWAAIYQLGIAWHFGAIRRLWAAVLALGAAGVMAVAIGFGPYPVSMIGVPGQVVQNSAPPSIVMLALGAAQAGALIAAAPSVTRWLRKSRLKHALAVVNSRVMLLYLWHMVGVVVVTVVAYPLGLFPQPTLGSVDWWLSRVLWVIVLSLVTAGLLAIVGWGRSALAASLFSVPVRLPGTWSSVALLIGTGMAAVALWRISLDGFAPAGRFPVSTALVFACGVALASLRSVRAVQQLSSA